MWQEFATLFKKIQIPSFNSKRTLIKKPYRNFKPPGGIKYEGFTYYPRTPDFKDPPYDPTKLFLIRRIRHLKGTNKYEKYILGLLNIDGQVKQFGDISIVKNIPEINAMLWKVKHLVKITPINIVNGLPEDGDYNGAYLMDNGDFIVSPKLKIDPIRIEAGEKLHKDGRKMDRSTLAKYLRDRWLNPLDGTV